MHEREGSLLAAERKDVNGMRTMLQSFANPSNATLRDEEDPLRVRRNCDVAFLAPATGLLECILCRHSSLSARSIRVTRSITSCAHQPAQVWAAKEL